MTKQADDIVALGDFLIDFASYSVNKGVSPVLSVHPAALKMYG